PSSPSTRWRSAASRRICGADEEGRPVRPSFPPEPAHPSHPPPPPDRSVRPMSALGAAAWTLAATVLFLWLVGLTLTLRPGAEKDIVNAFGCQALAYLV